MEIVDQMAALREAVKNLSLSSSLQVKYIHSLSCNAEAPLADELALEFDDAYSPFKENLDELNWSEDARSKLLELDALLNEMSMPRNRHLWCVDAVENSREWQAVREKAAHILAVYKR